MSDRVRRAALAELGAALSGAGGLPRGARVEAALLSESPAAQRLCLRGACDLHLADPAADAFACLWHGTTLWLLGNTPRGLLQAVFELQDAIARRRVAGERVLLPPRAWRREGAFRPACRFFHARFQGWPGSRADVRAIARLGATHNLVSHDWQGSRRSLHGYVSSPIFPGATPAAVVAANAAGLRRMLDDGADYGLDAALWLTELPCQGGPWVPEPERQAFLDRYTADCLSDSGTYEGRVLCFGHPQVQAFYRDLLARFFVAFPEVGVLFVFGRDSGGEFCDPSACPRCRGLSLFDQRDRLLRFLLDEGARARPGLRVLTTNWGWDADPAEFARRQAELPPGSGVYYAAQRDGWQCERQAHDPMRDVRRVCRERGQWFVGYDDLHWGDDTVHLHGDIQDFPFGVGAKLRRWHALEADGVFDHWGPFPESAWNNSLACRAFFLNPLADPEAVCRDIAQAQYGARPARHVVAAWRRLERAHAVLSNACTWSPWQWPGWYAGREAHPLPGQMEAQLDALARHAESAKPAGPVTFNGGTLAERLGAVGDAWRRAWPLYRRAAERLRQAQEEAGDEPVGFAHWWDGQPPAPARRRHLELQRVYVLANGLAGAEIGAHFALLGLYESLGRDAGRYRRAAKAGLRADRAACLAAAEYFDALAGEFPGRIDGWPAQYRAKAEAIQAWLEA